MTPAPFDIRIEPANTREAMELGTYAFASSPVKLTDEEIATRLARRSDDKGIFSYVDGVPVAKVGIIPMTMNVRGVVMPMGGIGGVCSMPIARRGGHVRALMLRAIEEMHANGQAVSMLYPFKTSYYEMFGYAGWQMALWVRVNPAALAPYMKLPKYGTVKQRLSTEASDELYALLGAAQRHIHGMAIQPRGRFGHELESNPTWFASVHEGDEITGGLSYKLDLDKQVMVANAAFWLTENAKLHLFDFMARHVDQVKHISLAILPGEYPHLWVTDDDQVTVTTVEDHVWNAPMGRIVTISGLGGIGAGAGTVTLNVRDEHAPWNTGTWTFTGAGGSLAVTEGGNPQGDVSIHGLAAMVLSGINPAVLPHRGWGDVQPAAHTALQSIFPPVMPHLHEQF